MAPTFVAASRLGSRRQTVGEGVGIRELWCNRDLARFIDVSFLAFDIDQSQAIAESAFYAIAPDIAMLAEAGVLSFINNDGTGLVNEPPFGVGAQLGTRDLHVRQSL